MPKVAPSDVAARRGHEFPDRRLHSIDVDFAAPERTMFGLLDEYAAAPPATAIGDRSACALSLPVGGERMLVFA